MLQPCGYWLNCQVTGKLYKWATAPAPALSTEDRCLEAHRRAGWLLKVEGGELVTCISPEGQEIQQVSTAVDPDPPTPDYIEGVDALTEGADDA